MFPLPFFVSWFTSSLSAHLTYVDSEAPLVSWPISSLRRSALITSVHTPFPTSRHAFPQPLLPMCRTPWFSQWRPFQCLFMCVVSTFFFDSCATVPGVAPLRRSTLPWFVVSSFTAPASITVLAAGPWCLEHYSTLCSYPPGSFAFPKGRREHRE